MVWSKVFISPRLSCLINKTGSSQYLTQLGACEFQMNENIYYLQNVSNRACLPVESLQSCPILCHPADCCPPGSSVHGILQARILEQVAISFSRESSQARDQTWVSYIACTGDGGLGWVSLPLAPPGNSQQKWGAVKDSFSS